MYYYCRFNKLSIDVFNARLTQANLITKTDFDAKLSSLNRKTTANKSKQLLVENESKNLKTFYSSYKSHFEEDGTQNVSQFKDILKLLLVLVMVVTFITRNLKDCLRKELILLEHLIIFLFYT